MEDCWESEDVGKRVVHCSKYAGLETDRMTEGERLPENQLLNWHFAARPFSSVLGTRLTKQMREKFCLTFLNSSPAPDNRSKII